MKVLVCGEGASEHGLQSGPFAGDDNKPALPELVHRILDKPSEMQYTCDLNWTKMASHALSRSERVGSFAEAPTKGMPRKVARIIAYALAQGFDAVVIVRDRDRQDGRRQQLEEGRDYTRYDANYPPCAVGVAVETFDAWMLADPLAVEEAGGDKAKCHPAPENLDGKEGTGKHPKDLIAQAFGGPGGLREHYPIIARELRLDHLERFCPKGFARFARDVREHLGG